MVSKSATIGTVFQLYFDYAKARLKTHDRDYRKYKRYFAELAEQDALSLTRAEVEELRQNIAGLTSNRTANSIIELLKTAYNKAVEYRIIKDYNPARGLPKLPIDERNRTLEYDELPTFFQALASLRNQLTRDFILTCIFTGEQASRISAMKWSDLQIKDQNRCVWFIEQRKRGPRTAFLEPEARDILLRRQTGSDGEWIFPMVSSKTGHFMSWDKSWTTLIKRSGIKGLRLDDLRRCRQNLEPIRQAMTAYYYVPLARNDAAEEKAKRQTQYKEERERKAAVMAAMAQKVERPPMQPRVLSPSGSESKEPTLAAVFNWYMETHGSQCMSASKIEGYYHRFLEPRLADRPVDQIRPSDVQNLVNWLSTHIGKPTANRVVEYLSAMINAAIRLELVTCRNPVSAVSRPKLQSRDKFFSTDQVELLFEAMKRRPRSHQFNAYIKVCLFTAAREGNVREMRWEQIDWQDRTWRIPITKNGEPHVVPLIDDAIAAIESQRGAASAATPRGEPWGWVFPGNKPGEHMTYPGNQWCRLLKDAGLEGLHIHDLRRTNASHQARAGVPVHTIGLTLGHKDARSTQIYARLDTKTKREAMQKGVNKMFDKDDQPKAEKVVDPAQVAILIESLQTLLSNTKA